MREAATKTPSPTVGSAIAHYRILHKIGSGGMGEVYLAEDTKLDRKVALKVLPPDLAGDAARRARLIREAKAVAALSHPNIVTLYSVEEADGALFITMEFVPGKTLAEILPKKGLAPRRFFDIAIPMTDALAAAHAQGIVHRDLKPANVMVTDDGRVKVLDFGLAKAILDASSGGDAGPATQSATQDGHIVGTPAYMSPEQAEGKTTDARSDIFSLGMVFYEMLTGERAFAGGTAAAVLSILRDSPRPIGELRPDAPRELARLVHRCLAKNPTDRFQSAIDLRHSLEDTKQDVDSSNVRPNALDATPRSKTKLEFMAGAAVIVALASLWWLSGREQLSRDEAPRLQNAMQITSSLDVESYPTWSPDGSRLAYQASEGYLFDANHDIWVTQLGSGEPVNLTKGFASINRMPSWSPDGREIAFVSNRNGAWAVYTMAATGGNVRNILSLQETTTLAWSAPQWSKDGRTLFIALRQADQNIVHVVSLGSLQPTRMALPAHDGNVCRDLTVSPNGRRFAYVEGGGESTEVTRLWTISIAGGDPVPVTDGRTNVRSPTWSADGRHLFYVSNRGGSMDLWRQAVTEDAQPVGEPLAITPGLGIRSAAFSSNGTKLAYSRGGRVSNVWRVPILAGRPATWIDAVQLTSERAFIEFVDVSPNGTQLAVSSDRRGNQDLWILPASGGAMTQLTTDPTPDWDPAWSPNGSEIAFYAYRGGSRDIWVMPSGGGPARQLTFHAAQDQYPRWSPNGQEIVFLSRRTVPPSLFFVDAKGGEQRLATPGGDWSRGDWSEQWLAVAKQRKLYLVAKDGREVPLPRNNADFHRFSRDGRFIYYSVVSGPRSDQDLWRLSLRDRTTSRLTKLEGKRGQLGYAFSADASYLYFTWYEDDGDIWVMDVAPNAK